MKYFETVGREIPLGAVFDSPSVAGLAAWLRADGYDTTSLRPRELPLTPESLAAFGGDAALAVVQGK